MTARDLIWQLATIRYRRGITQAAIAEHMGVPRSAISRLESEQKPHTPAVHGVAVLRRPQPPTHHHTQGHTMNDYVMPQPPKGMIWVLKLNTADDSIDLWLYRKSRITGRSNGWSVRCDSVINPDVDRFVKLRLSDPAELIAKAVLVKGIEVRNDIAKDPERLAQAEAKEAELSRLLTGVQIKIEGR